MNKKAKTAFSAILGIGTVAVIFRKATSKLPPKRLEQCIGHIKDAEEKRDTYLKSHPDCNIDPDELLKTFYNK